MTDPTMTKTVALLPELKSCPFCDGPVHKRLLETVEACFHIGAPYCPVMSHRLMTIEQWNTRTQTDQQLREEVERLREALEPFARAADVKLCGEWADDKHFGQTDVGFYLTFGDLRRARSSLSSSSLSNG